MRQAWNFLNIEGNMRISLTIFAAAALLCAAALLQQPAAQPTPAPKQAAMPETPPQPSGQQTGKSSKRPKKIRRKSSYSPPAVDPRKINSLLYGAMERLETLSSIYANLGLCVSTGTLKKAYELDSAVNKAAALYFKIPEPRPDREGIKNYRGLLESALRSLRILKDLRGRMKPNEAGPAISAAGELWLAIDEELAGPKMIPIAAAPKPRPGEAGPPGTSAETTGREDAKPSSTGEYIANETETLFSISEVTFALSAYRKETGSFPGHLSDLTPKYLPALPTISIAGHLPTTEVLDEDSRDYDADLAKTMKDTGKWIYFSNKKSKYYGRVFVDCTHKDAQGVEFYKIGGNR
jgi:hypothetical protein